MNELIKINCESADRPTVMGRELHEALGIKSNYTTWFNRMCEYGFTENSDFVAVGQKCLTAQGNETTYTDHCITLDMAKEICMIQRSELGKKCRLYFIEVEKELNSPERVMKRALTLADERIKLLEQEKLNAPISSEQYDTLCNEVIIKAIDLCSSGRVYVKIGLNVRYDIEKHIHKTFGVDTFRSITVRQFDEALQLCRTFKPSPIQRKRILDCRAELKQ